MLMADGLSTAAAEGDGASSAGGVAQSDAEAASGSGEASASPHASRPGIDEHEADRDSDAGRA